MGQNKKTQAFQKSVSIAESYILKVKPDLDSSQLNDPYSRVFLRPI